MNEVDGLLMRMNVVESKVNTHEAVCAERYGGINARLRRLEGWIVTMVAATMGLMATIIVKGLS